jgi:aminobenzoyl-glutamate utilization protein B
MNVFCASLALLASATWVVVAPAAADPASPAPAAATQAPTMQAAATQAAEPAPALGVFATSDGWIDVHAAALKEINQFIWHAAELGLQEHASSAKLIAFLKQEGFDVREGVAGMPTAFVAETGRGKPVIGILAEYDALPGLSQQPVPERKPRDDDNDAGHACGHSIYGTASVGAAAAAAVAMREAGLAGTIRLYGTPAEETGIGKVYMARDGLFDDLDAAFHWHAGGETRVQFASSKAVISIKFRFEGLAAHASLSPEAGRSALDAVELMDVGTNFLREHLTEDSRMHYVITDGGGQPNVVPATAEVWYYLRADSHAYAEYMLERVRQIAAGAALMTATTVSDHIDSDIFELLPNRPLSEVLQEQLERVGPPVFDDEERAFARETQRELRSPPAEPLATAVDPLAAEAWHLKASTDVGNVSWAVPTSGINVATYTLGAPGHSWQIAACTGMSIGEKGMLVAAKALAGATLELLTHPARLEDARRDFETRRAATEAPTYTLPEDQRAPASIR